MRFARALIAAAVAALLLPACASLGPRFSPEIATALAQDEMRRMETKGLVVYYPAHAREAVLAIAGRIEACSTALFRRALSHTERGKPVVIITSAEFNNAFVRWRLAGSPAEMVLPVQMGLELFNFFDLGVTNVGDVACHEAVHYVHLEQIDGFWRYVNLIFGNVISPNIATEGWFIEGLATWLEGNLGRAGGRPHSPLWTGVLAAGAASQGGRLHPAQLSPMHRELYPYGGSYLAGADFVAWLAKTHGEQRLWQLIDEQGRAEFFPFGVTLRFRGVYGRTIGQLFDDYARERAADFVMRERPSSQRVRIADAGYFARLASGPQGELALLSVGLDREARLEVFEPDGRVRFSHLLARIFPGRPWISTHPLSMGGLSFSRDGRFLFAFAEDVGADTGSRYELRQFDARTGAHLRSWPGLKGLGGDVAPDGRSYVFIQIVEGVPNLARLALDTGAVEPLTRFEERGSMGAIAHSPDGRRLAFSRRGPEGFDLHVLEADGAVRRLTSDGRFNYGARWLSDQEILFSREEDGRAQAHAIDVATGAIRRITDAPWALFDPAPLPGGRIAFLNREGWRWTIDEAPLPAREAAATGPALEARTLPPGDDPGGAVETTPTPEVLKDAPYSGADELFIPRIRAPSGFYIDTSGRFAVSADFLGFDRLGRHSWAASVGYDSLVREPSIAVGYGNHQLAPWFLTLTAGRSGQRSFTAAADGSGEIDTRVFDTGVAASASRPFWTTSLSFGAEALWRRQDSTMPTGETFTLGVRLVGPSASVSWFAGEGTAYAGTRRGLALEARAAAYPKAVGSDFNLVDLRGAVGVWVPMPLPRATFMLSLRGRAVTLAPEGGLLRVGGVSDGVSVGVPRDAAPPALAPPNLFLPFGFVEPLRGYEDFGFRANAVAIAGARLRYPLIVDWGTTSTFWLFPSFFLRQIEAEAFGEVARKDLPPYLPASAGFTARVRTLWGSLFPITLFYQYAYRFEPGFEPHHIFGIAAE